LARWADEGKVAAVVEQLKRAKGAGVTLAGSVSSGCFSRTILSGHGAILSEEGSIAKAQFISQTDKASGYAAGFSNDLAGLGFERLCGESIDKARRADKRVELDIGRYDVVLEPPAVSELLEWMTGIAFTARSAEDGTSFVAGRKGEAVTGAAISLFDDASRPFGLGLGSHFDGEGQVPQRVRFVTEGRAGEVVQSAASGARNGCGSTGHSDGAGGEQVNHLHMLGGDASIEQLVSRLDRGIWVNRFHYVNGLLDPPKATMTGLTRDGCLYVEKGEVVGGFAPMRFTDSILEAFSRCDGVTEQLTAVASQWRDGGSLVVPALLIRGFPFTSKQKAIS
jgi:predicted Zn-dependent protease